MRALFLGIRPPCLTGHLAAVPARASTAGASYVEQEATRLRKMASDNGVTAQKKETFTWRANVLGSFSSAPKSEL
jgi:hypothetical protein